MLVTIIGICHYYDKPTKNSLSNKEVVYVCKIKRYILGVHLVVENIYIVIVLHVVNMSMIFIDKMTDSSVYVFPTRWHYINHGFVQ